MKPDGTVIPGSTAVGDPVRTVAGAIRDRADELAERMIAAYAERIPSYRNAGPELLDDARSWAEGSVGVVTGIVLGEVAPREFTDALMEVGRKRAQEGVPLADVLLANLIATEILWQAASEASPHSLDQKVQVQKAFMDASIDLLQHAVIGLSAGYIEVDHGRVADEELDLQVLVETLAGLRVPDRRHDERAERHGIDLEALRWCIVGRTHSEDTGAEIRQLRRTLVGAAVGRLGRKVVAYLPGEDSWGTLPLAHAGISHATDPDVAFRRAARALKVAEHLDRPVAVYEEVVPLALVLDGPQEDHEAFIEAQLGPLLTDPLGDELLRSLRTYYASGQSVAAAARELFVHRHTLEYRLQRIETALGRDIKEYSNRMLLEFALGLRKVPEGETEEGPR